MPTVQEILKQTGMTDEQITALDPKIVSGVTQVLSTANQTLEQAELAKRAQAQQYDTEIAPALDKWANDSANLEANLAFYKTQAQKAKEAGFLPADAPGTPPAAPPRTADGKFVAGQNQVPGSPEFVSNLRKEAGAAIGSMLDLTWKYQSLYGTPMPDSPTVLISEANALRIDPIAHAAKKYDFAGKEKEIADKKQKAHDDAITAAAVAENDKKWSERVGNNPMVRQAEVSRFSTLEKAVKAGERPDPLTMTREQRHVSTRNAIIKDVQANETVQ